MTPAFPVWVTHGGGHYTVLWCRDDAVLQHGGGFLGGPPILIPDDNDMVLVEPTTPAQQILPRMIVSNSSTSPTNQLSTSLWKVTTPLEQKATTCSTTVRRLIFCGL